MGYETAKTRFVQSEFVAELKRFRGPDIIEADTSGEPKSQIVGMPLNDVVTVSEYELEKQRNIEENRELMRQLGLAF